LIRNNGISGSPATAGSETTNQNRMKEYQKKIIGLFKKLHITRPATTKNNVFNFNHYCFSKPCRLTKKSLPESISGRLFYFLFPGNLSNPG